ncbi:NUDIX domain-containing protein, partial [Deinococcus koreensis]
RVAILCRRGGTLLTNASDGLAFHFVPGGALSTDEDVAICAVREWQEETGVPPGPMRLVGIVENFFGPPDRRQHEIGFYFLMPAPESLPADRFSVQDNADVWCQWAPVAGIADVPVYPLVIRELLEVPPGTVRHLVNREAASA